MQRIESTVTQKTRTFLDTLGEAPPAAASAREVEAWLISRVRKRGDDPEVRRLLRELLGELADQDLSRLPAPQCETLSGESLADELASLLAARVPSLLNTKRRPTTALIAAALLICGAALGGCRGGKVRCGVDTSTANFVSLLQKSNYFSWDEIESAKGEYAAMTPGMKCGYIRALNGENVSERSYTPGIDRIKVLDDLKISHRMPGRLRSTLSGIYGRGDSEYELLALVVSDVDEQFKKKKGAAKAEDPPIDSFALQVFLDGPVPSALTILRNEIRDRQNRRYDAARPDEIKDEGHPSSFPDCASDTSLEHLSQFLPDERNAWGAVRRDNAAVKVEFESMAPRDRKAVMADFCQMSPDEIRKCIEEMFYGTENPKAGPKYDRSGDINYAVLYKGVDL